MCSDVGVGSFERFMFLPVWGKGKITRKGDGYNTKCDGRDRMRK